MAFDVIVIFRAPDGEHVGKIEFQDAPHMVSDAVCERHAIKHFTQGEHTSLVKWWRARGPKDLEETRVKLLKKYAKRTPIEELTGGQPTRSLGDPSVFETEDSP